MQTDIMNFKDKLLDPVKNLIIDEFRQVMIEHAKVELTNIITKHINNATVDLVERVGGGVAIMTEFNYGKSASEIRRNEEGLRGVEGTEERNQEG